MVNRSVQQLTQEEITGIMDLLEYTKTDIESIIHAFECPPHVLNRGNNLVNQTAFIFLAKSQKHMLVVIQIAVFHDQINCVVTSAMMQWAVLKNFSVEFEALNETTTTPDIEL